MGTRRIKDLAVGLCGWIGLGLLTPGCAVPVPNDLVLLDVPGAQRYALSTEDGIIAINGDDLAAGIVPILYYFRVQHIGTQHTISDDAKVLQKTDELALLEPVSTQMNFSDLAAQDAEPGEAIFIQILDLDDPEMRPVLLKASLFENGRYGNLLLLEDSSYTPEHVARTFAGAGLYVQRMGRFVIVGILSGMVASNPVLNTGLLSRFETPPELLPFISLEVIAPVLPRTSDFFERRKVIYRPDIEYGLEPDGAEPPPARRE